MRLIAIACLLLTLSSPAFADDGPVVEPTPEPIATQTEPSPTPTSSPAPTPALEPCGPDGFPANPTQSCTVVVSPLQSMNTRLTTLDQNAARLFGQMSAEIQQLKERVAELEAKAKGKK